LTISSIILAIVSVILLRTFDKDFDREKTTVIREIKAIMDFNRNFFEEIDKNKTSSENTKILRDKFAKKISYKQLFDKREDFKNFKYLPDKDIYGFQLLNNTHVGFYHNSYNCGKINDDNDYCGGVIIDTNGYTRPNRFGKDQFLLKIYKNGVIE